MPMCALSSLNFSTIFLLNIRDSGGSCYHRIGRVERMKVLGVPFVQEVIAGTQATRRFYPEADVIIELGGGRRETHVSTPHPEQAYERHLRGRQRRVYRSNGDTAEN